MCSHCSVCLGALSQRCSRAAHEKWSPRYCCSAVLQSVRRRSGGVTLATTHPLITPKYKQETMEPPIPVVCRHVHVQVGSVERTCTLSLRSSDFSLQLVRPQPWAYWLNRVHAHDVWCGAHMASPVLSFNARRPRDVRQSATCVPETLVCARSAWSRRSVEC